MAGVYRGYYRRAPRRYGQRWAATKPIPNSPDDIAGLVGWWKADAITGLVDGDPVSSWTDSSTVGRALTAAGTARPTYKTGIINGLPVLRFDGTDDALSISPKLTDSGTGPTKHTILIVYANRSGTNGSFFGDAATLANAPLQRNTQVWASGSYADITATGPGINLNTHKLYSEAFDFDNDTYSVWLEGTLVATDTTARTTGNIDSIGRASTEFLTGDIAEIIVYDSVLSTSDRQGIESYLTAKYAIGVPQTVTGAATLSGSGTLAATGVRTRSGAATVAGAGTLTATGTRVRLGAATLAGTGSLATSGTRTTFAVASVSGTGALTATGTRTVLGAAALSGAGSLSASGNVTGGSSTVTGAAALTGTASLAATGTRTALGAATLAGAGSLTATGTRTALGGTSLTATGSLTVTTTLHTGVGAASLAGTGALTASGTRTTLGETSLTGTGSLTGQGYGVRFGAAALSGTGALTAEGTGISIYFGAADLAGVGSLTASGVVRRTGPAGTLLSPDGRTQLAEPRDGRVSSGGRARLATTAGGRLA